MPIKQDPIGRGSIVWLGINEKRGGFSSARRSVTIAKDGIVDDIYRGMFRKLKGHDVDYIETDGMVKGDWVINHRQITIVDSGEVVQAGLKAGAPVISRSLLRENIAVNYRPMQGCPQFGQIPAWSRMVIRRGEEDLKVLYLTEGNGPCKTICRPIAQHFGGDKELAANLEESLKGLRGLMAMVRSHQEVEVRVGDSFVVFPTMR